MYTSFQLAKKYIDYYFTASNGAGHGMHSPFVFDLIKSVLKNRHNYTPPASIEALRKQLLGDDRLIQIKDLGAGSRLQNTSHQKISTLARRAVKPKKYGQLLFRLAKHYRSKTIVELGTSLGVTTAYLAVADEEATVMTIEGSPAIQEVAVTNFTKLGLKNIESAQGNFDVVLPQMLSRVDTVDLAYIDGNHRLIPTLHYLELFLAISNNDTILIFDDIHWSAEMEEAWEKIKEHEAVRTTIDLFFIGIVLLRSEFKWKQHFKVYF